MDEKDCAEAERNLNDLPAVPRCDSRREEGEFDDQKDEHDVGPCRDSCFGARNRHHVDGGI